MSLAEGQQVELTIEKPASGGRMIARHLGQIVLVRGAIPGERVRAWIERAEKRMAYAVTREVLEPSPDRARSRAAIRSAAARSTPTSPTSASSPLKSDVDPRCLRASGPPSARRPVEVAGSPEEGYRMRARFHVHGARAGFFREGTHQLCDAAATRQLSSDAVCLDAARHRGSARRGRLRRGGVDLDQPRTSRGPSALRYLELAPGSQVDADDACHASRRRGLRASARTTWRRDSRSRPGNPVLVDPLSAIAGQTAGEGTLRAQWQSRSSRAIAS